MTSKELFGNAKWVSPSNDCNQPLIRCEFTAKNIVSAEMIICGLGFFELYINGNKVSDDLLVPAWTNYEKRWNDYAEVPIDEKMNYRIYAMRYDVSEYLRDGENALGVFLGSGWYHRLVEGNSTYGDVKLCYRLKLYDAQGKEQVLVSDDTLKWTQSHIIDSKMLIGEKHDYRINHSGWSNAGYNDANWQSVTITHAPESEFYFQECPADKIIRYITPEVVKRFENYTVYDIGENITGYPILACDSNQVEEIAAEYAELLYEDGTLSFESYNRKEKNWQRDEYITNGKPGEYHPKFLWHAFRYFSVTNNATPKTCAVVHSDVDQTAEFECDNKNLNWLFEAFVRTQLCNMHCGIPSDCPQREGRGYTGDGQLACDAAMLVLDGREFYKKWLADISDCQNIENGHVQYTAPFVPSGGGPGGWGCAIVEVPYIFYKHYGDAEVLKSFFPQMLKYFEYLEAHSENDLVTSEEPWAWCLGDWCTPDKIAIPEPFVNTYFYIKSMNEVREIAQIIGKPECIPMLDTRIAAKKKAIEKAYFDPATGNFAQGIQGANAFAVDIGMGDKRTLENIVKKYSDLGMYDTGIFGTDILTKTLFERGYHELAITLMGGDKEVSFGNMRRSNATTLWEYWTGDKSNSHPMFGAVTRFLFYYLLGIRQTKDSVAFEKVVIEPAIVEQLYYAKGFIMTPKGKIAVSYVKTDEKIRFEIFVEQGITAQFKYQDNTYNLKIGKNKFLL